jgi:hypothetical protein
MSIKAENCLVLQNAKIVFQTEPTTTTLSGENIEFLPPVIKSSISVLYTLCLKRARFLYESFDRFAHHVENSVHFSTSPQKCVRMYFNFTFPQRNANRVKSFGGIERERKRRGKAGK